MHALVHNQGGVMVRFSRGIEAPLLVVKELIHCSLCRARCDAESNPAKILDCLHTVCSSCVTATPPGGGQLRCLTCGLTTVVSDTTLNLTGGDLPLNFIADEVETRAGAQSLLCDGGCNVCEARMYCPECLEALCEVCFTKAEKHCGGDPEVEHRGVPIRDVLVLQGSRPMECFIHPGHALETFCSVDAVPMCTQCSAASAHEGHTSKDHVSLANASRSLRRRILSGVEVVRDLSAVCGRVENDVMALGKMAESSRQKTIHDIEQTYDKILERVHEAKNAALGKVEELYERTMTNLEEHSTVVSSLNSEFVSCAEAAELLVHAGDDVGLMMVEESVMKRIAAVKALAPHADAASTARNLPCIFKWECDNNLIREIRAGIPALGVVGADLAPTDKLDTPRGRPIRVDAGEEDMNHGDHGSILKATQVKSDWKEATDASTGRTYYYNQVTRETRWTLPETDTDSTKALTKTSPSSRKRDVKESIAALFSPKRGNQDKSKPRSQSPKDKKGSPKIPPINVERVAADPSPLQPEVSFQERMLIRVVQAKDLFPAADGKTPNPMCQIALNGVVKETRALRATSSPVWNEDLVFDFPSNPGPGNMWLEAVIRDQALPESSKDNIIGILRTPIPAELPKTNKDQWFTLTHRPVPHAPGHSQNGDTNHSGALRLQIGSTRSIVEEPVPKAASQPHMGTSAPPVAWNIPNTFTDSGKKLMRAEQAEIAGGAKSPTSLRSTKNSHRLLKEVFVHYASPSGTAVLEYGPKLSLPSSKFTKLVRDCGMMSGAGMRENNLDSAQCDVIYAKVCKAGSMGPNSKSKNVKMTYEQFCRALVEVAKSRFPTLHEDSAVDRVLVDYVLPKARSQHVGQNDRDALVKFLERYDELFRSIFYAYAADPVVVGDDSALSAQRFQRMLVDFDIVPRLLSKEEAYQAFGEVPLEKMLGTDRITLAPGSSAVTHVGFVDALANVVSRTFPRSGEKQNTMLSAADKGRAFLVHFAKSGAVVKIEDEENAMRRVSSPRSGAHEKTPVEKRSQIIGRLLEAALEDVGAKGQKELRTETHGVHVLKVVVDGVDGTPWPMMSGWKRKSERWHCTLSVAGQMKATAKTSFSDKGGSIEWNSACLFDIDPVRARYDPLHARLYCEGKEVGWASYSLARLTTNREIGIVEPINGKMAQKDSKVIPSLRLRILYSDGKSNTSGLGLTPRVRVTVAEGRGLLHRSDANLGTVSDPCCEITLEEETYRTRVLESTAKGEWNETFEASLKNPNSHLTVMIYDWERIGADAVIGQCRIPLGPMFRVKTVETANEQVPALWYTLHRRFIKGQKEAGLSTGARDPSVKVPQVQLCIETWFETGETPLVRSPIVNPDEKPGDGEDGWLSDGDDIPDVLESVGADLKEVFKYYASYGRPNLSEWLSQPNFARLARELKILGGGVAAADVDILFIKTKKSGPQWPQHGHATDIDYGQFLDTLPVLARKKFPSKSTVAVSLRELLYEVIIPAANTLGIVARHQSSST